jgi:hypothetical protein
MVRFAVELTTAVLIVITTGGKLDNLCVTIYMKLFLSLIKHHAVKTCGSRDISQRILNLVNNEGERSVSRPSRLASGVRVLETSWIRDWAGPTSSLGAVEKREISYLYWE